MFRQATIALSLALAAPAFAQDQTEAPQTAVVGSMSGTIDGQPASFDILDGEGIETGWSTGENGIEVRIEATPSDTPLTDDNRLYLRFAADAGTRQPTTRYAEVELVDDGTSLTASGDGVGLALDTVEVSSDTLTVLGNMRPTVGPDAGETSVLSSEGRTLSLDIQTNVIRAPEGEAR